MMNILQTINQSPVANLVAVSNFFVPCVPISISTNLVSFEPLAKKLTTTVTSSAPELVQISQADFINIQLKKSELRNQTDVCSVTNETLLDVCMQNMNALFANLASYQMMLGRNAELDSYGGDGINTQQNLQLTLQHIHDYAAAMGLPASSYCEDDVIRPELLFDACMKRVQLLQQRWRENCVESLELAMQMQREAVFGAAAVCLTEICQDGLDNQITIDPTPQAQEDVLVALSTFVDLPFSGVWPVLRKRTSSLTNSGGVQ